MSAGTVVVYRNQQFQPSETFIRLQAASLARYTPIFVGWSAADFPWRGAETIQLHNGMSSLRKAELALFPGSVKVPRELGGRDVRLVHAHFGVDGVYAAPIAAALDVPLIVTFHGFDATVRDRRLVASGNLSWINYALRRRKLFGQLSIAICVSEYIRERVVALGVPRESTVVAMVGTQIPASPGSGPRGLESRVVHVGRLVEKKGTTYLLAAFREVIKRVPSAELHVVGDGPLRSTLKRHAYQLGIAQNVTWHGSLPHARTLELIRSSAIAAAPSVTASSGDSEGLPTVLVEASAHGVPSVTTSHAGNPEAVIDGVTGFVVPERDVERLGEALCRLLTDAPLRRSFAEAAYDLARRRFSLTANTRCLEKLYASVSQDARS